ncbi:MAG: tRNA pseudouridine(55) synthase TruB [bacterium]
MTRAANTYNGILPYYKQLGITSHDAVNDIRKIIGQRQVGHTGTLDPRAEGLMLICLGSATKVTRFLTGSNKIYEAVITLGRSSNTFDSEGIDESSPSNQVPELSVADLDELLNCFRGKITQKVPIFSAVRVKGKKLYEFARQGKEVETPSREIEIFDISLMEYKKPDLNLRIECSAGTYIRTIANDIGEKLGCGAYLSALKRTQISSIHVDKALNLEDVKEFQANQKFQSILLKPEQLLDFGAFIVSEDFSSKVIDGRDPLKEDIVSLEGEFSSGDRIFLKDKQGNALAVGIVQVSKSAFDSCENENLFDYLRVLN